MKKINLTAGLGISLLVHVGVAGCFVWSSLYDDGSFAGKGQNAIIEVSVSGSGAALVNRQRQSAPSAAAPTLSSSIPLGASKVGDSMTASEAAVASGAGDAISDFPAPDYPSASREMGEEGNVLVRVVFSATGQAASIDLIQSSGFARLDTAARTSIASLHGQAGQARTYRILFRLK